MLIHHQRDAQKLSLCILQVYVYGHPIHQRYVFKNEYFNIIFPAGFAVNQWRKWLIFNIM